jgi:AraC-like DNA-binding protein
VQRATLEEFAERPVGRYVERETFAHFCLDASLWGVVLCGRPGLDDAKLLGRSLVLELAPPAEPHASLVDASRFEGADEWAFAALETYVKRFFEPLAQWVRKLALVRPAGLRGAVVAGIYEVLPRPYPVAVFDDLRSAAEWLVSGAAGGMTAAEVAKAVAEIGESAHGLSPLLSSLRQLLEQGGSALALSEAAKALGVSRRTLQRRLTGAGTSFQRELTDARIRVAQRLLEGSASVTRVALDTGFSSPQSFNATFRRKTGVSPTAWRSRRRNGG